MEAEFCSNFPTVHKLFSPVPAAWFPSLHAITIMKLNAEGGPEANINCEWPVWVHVHCIVKMMKSMQSV